MKTNLKRISKSALSVILALMMIMSTMAVGIMTANAATTLKVYFTPQTVTSWTEGTLNSSELTPENGYSFKLNYKYGSQGTETTTTDMTLESSTMGEKNVYSATASLPYDGLYQFMFLVYKDGNYYGKSEVYNNTSSWKSDISGWNNKVWNGTSWVDYVPDTGGGSTVYPATTEAILNKTSVMFYIESYSGTKLAVTNGTASNYIAATNLAEAKGYVTVPVTSLSTYKYISNNAGNNNGGDWGGQINADIPSSQGGEYYVSNSSTTTTAATTGTTDLSKTTLSKSTDTAVLLTTFSNKTTSSYGSNLYVQYYVDNELVAMDSNLAASSNTTYNLDVTGYTEGEHTLKTVLTDGKVYYVSDQDTFEIKSDSSLTANITGEGTVKFTVGGAEVKKAPAGAVVTIVATPATGYELGTITGVSFDSGNTFTMPATDVTANVTFNKIISGVTVTADDDTPFVGQSVTLTPNVTSGYATTTSYTVTKDGTDVTASVINGNTFTVSEASGVGAYTITCTATVADPAATETSPAITVTVSETAEQSAYSSLNSMLGTADYFAPSAEKQALYKKSVYDAYVAAYNTAKTIADGTYPTYDSTSTSAQDAKSALENAKAALVEKVALAQPTVTLSYANGVVASGETLDITVSNYSSYPADASVTLELRDSSNNAVSGVTFTNGKATIANDQLADGNYTVVAVAGNTDDYISSSASSEFSITNVTTYALTLTPFENATAVITFNDAHGAKQTVTSNSASVPVNTPVTITYTPAQGYEISSVTGTGATVSGSGNVYTLTMPASAVTVDTTVGEKTACNITVTSSDSTLGSAVLNDVTDVYIGNEFTVTATEVANLGKFSSWTVVSGATISADSSDTSATATFVATAKTITITANFSAYNYFVHTSGTDVPMSPSASNPKILISNDTIAQTTVFKLMRNYDTTSPQYSNSGNASTYWLKDNTPHVLTTWDSNSNPSDSKGYYVDASAARYIVYNTETGQVSLSETSDGKTPTKIYAKDGTIGGTAANGTTTIDTTVDGVTLSDASPVGYNIYAATEGSVVKVTTTVNDTAAATVYVHAFVINGKTYPALAGTDNTYTTEFISDGTTTYEITPIYYYLACKTEGEYITFYVDAKEMTDDFYWGNSIASYAYYYKTGGQEESDGAYPGQPMLYDEAQARYYCRVPKTINGNLVSGMTLNNYNNDAVHGMLDAKLTSNDQTYDFNDFKFLASLDYDIIRFDMKPRSGASGLNQTLVGSAFSYNKYQVNNGWEAFVDINGNKVDVLGNPIDEAQTKKLYVVSTASYNIPGLGEWMTKWFVYGDDGSLITSGVPSDFIPRAEGTENTDAYKAVETAGYVGAQTEITFENQQVYSNGTNRLDGRWYYAKSTDSVTADVMYRTTEDGTTFTAPVADAAYAVINSTETTVTYDKHGQSITVAAKPLAGYLFKGWYVASDWDDTAKDYKTYHKLDASLGSSFTTTLDADMHYVATYEKAGAGALQLSHLKYDAPDALGGLGYYLISATITKKDGTTETITGTGTGASGQTINFTEISAEDQKIVVTLTTTTGAENTFAHWYTTSSTGFEIIDDPDGDMTLNGAAITDPYGQKGTLTYTFEILPWKLFSGTKQVITEMPFYSDIAPVTKDAVLNYKYYNRFGEERTYTKTVTLTDSYIETNGYTITDELIYSNAPAIEDIYKNCVWTITEQTTTKTGTTATIWGTHKENTYDVILNDGVNPQVTKTVNLNAYLTDENGNFYTAPSKNADGTAFAYWLVTEDGKEAAKCFSNEFNLKIVGNYLITAVYKDVKEDSLTIGEPTYSREQFTDSSGNVVSDYLYADFMVAYMSSYGILLNGAEAANQNYHTGLIVEFDKDIKVSQADATGATLTETLTEYTSDDAAIKTIATDESKASGSLTVDGTRAMYKYDIDNSKYNNKNRLDYILKFKNTANFRHYVMKAYYYVYYTDPETNELVYKITEPVYFCLYDIGNSTADKTVTTS